MSRFHDITKLVGIKRLPEYKLDPGSSILIQLSAISMFKPVGVYIRTRLSWFYDIHEPVGTVVGDFKPVGMMMVAQHDYISSSSDAAVI